MPRSEGGGGGGDGGSEGISEFKKKGKVGPPNVLVDPREAKLAKLKQWSAAHGANQVPATFSPEAAKLQAALSTASFEQSRAWLSDKRLPGKTQKRVMGQVVDLLEEPESRYRVSSIIPEHRIVRGVYSDLSLDNAKKKRAELEVLKAARARANPARSATVPDYEMQLRQLKLDRAANRPSWNSSTEVLYPRLDPRQLERSKTTGSVARGSSPESPNGVRPASPAASPTTAAARTFTAFPVSPSENRAVTQKKCVAEVLL